jgi:hypothetical protein
MKSAVLSQAQKELAKHIWDNFVVGEDRAIGQGGKGVVVVGCVSCKLAMQTRQQYMRHLTDDVLPGIVDMVIERTAIAES